MLDASGVDSTMKLGLKRDKKLRSKVLYMYGQRKAYMTLKSCQICENGRVKTKFYRKLSFAY